MQRTMRDELIFKELMDHHPSRWGQPIVAELQPTAILAGKGDLSVHPMRAKDDFVGCSSSDSRQHTLNPSVTGTSVIGIKYAEGVMLAADCLASYGSLARFRDVQRLFSLNAACALGTSGDMADYQYLQTTLRNYQYARYLA